MIIKTIKAILLNIIQEVSPSVYKRIFFKKIDKLNWQSIKNKNIENELLLISYLLNENEVFVDIGANLGQYVFKASQITNPKNIYAFEPNPTLNKRLKKLFRDVQVIPEALSSEKGVFKFKIPIFGNKEIHTRGTLKTEHAEISETDYRIIEVKAGTLDDFAVSFNPEKIKLIKIDVEGAEFDVISGASALINKYQPVLIIEIEQRHHKDSIKEFMNEFEKKFSYKTFYFDPDLQQLKDDILKMDIDLIQSEVNHAKNRSFINNFIFLPISKFDSYFVDDINLKIRSKNL